MNLHRPTTRCRFAYVLAAVLPAACAGEEPGAAASAVRDSAGVRIVESAQPVWTPDEAPRLSLDPVLSIGQVEGDAGYLFHGILGVRRLSDGRFVVANYGTSELRFFDPAGRFLFGVGGEGEGPGEFRLMSLFWSRAGDTLVVADAGGLTIIDPQGRYVRAIRPATSAGGLPVRPVGQLDDGTMLGSGSARGVIAPTPGTLFRDSLHFYRIDPDGSIGGRLTTLAAGELWPFEAGGGTPLRVPFSAHPAWAATGNRFYLAGGREPEIEVWRADGVLERIIRWSPPSRELTSEAISRYRSHLLASTTNPDRQRQHERFLAEVPMPDRMPATGELFAILVDEARTIWVESYRLPWDEETEWLVFSAEGEWLGSVRTPPGLTVHQVGRDFVLGSWRDELGVEYVRMYDVEGSR